jgi:2-methylcitrate dehydratase PrpD
MTQGATELALRLQQAQHIDAEHIAHIEARVPAYGFRLVGHNFTLGENPRVNAQFSLQYCVANALVRKASTLDHFRPERIDASDVLTLAHRVSVIHDPALDAREHTSVALQVTMTNGAVWRDALDIAPGFPGQALTDEEHAERFAACLSYAARSDSTRRALLERIDSIDLCDDVRELVDLTLPEH